MKVEISNELKNGYRVVLKEYPRPEGRKDFWLNITREPSKSRHPKPELNYLYRTIEAAQQAEENFFKSVELIQQRRIDRKNEKTAAKANMQNPYKVGQIVYDSWGYDQTNIDFYQVVEVLERSVVIRPIGGEYVEGSGGMMCANVKPVKDQIVGEPIKKILQVMTSNGNSNYYIKSKHGWISNYEKGEKGVYSSWYA